MEMGTRRYKETTWETTEVVQVRDAVSETVGAGTGELVMNTGLRSIWEAELTRIGNS